MQIAADRAWVGRHPVLDNIARTDHCFGQYYSDTKLFWTRLLRHMTVLGNITKTYNCFGEDYSDISLFWTMLLRFINVFNNITQT